VKVYMRKGVEKDERSIYIEMQQIEELNKQKNLKIQFLENSLKESIVKIFNGKKLSSGIDSLKSGTKLEIKD
ncbi:MAG: hypothetical protein ACKO7P_02375, partial [Bacteroidota bacterium]